MDKLQPIIKHKFWIFAAIAILTPLYPWMSTVTAMKSDYASRSDAIKQSIGKVPKDKNPPNDNWTKPVKDLTAQQQGRYVETQKMLWEMQKPLLVWPKEIDAAIRENAIPFWGELPTPVLRKYKKDYLVYKLNLRKLLKGFTPKSAPPGGAPVNPAQAAENKPKHGEELIAFPFTALPLPDLDQTTTDLSSKDVWETQEDMWLLENLFNAINQVNQQQPLPPQSQLDAAIKELITIELRGGTKSRLNPGAAGSSIAGPSFSFDGSSGPPSAPLNLPVGGLLGVGPPGAGAPPPQNPGTLNAGSSKTDIVSFSFDASEEFGVGKISRSPSARSAAVLPGAAPGGGLAVRPGGAQAAVKPAAPAATSAPGTPGKAVVPDPQRYVDKNPELFLRTRAFYMELQMDHRKIPQLISELRNAPWPTRVYRVQMVAKEHSTAPSSQYSSTSPGVNAAPAGGGFGIGRRRSRKGEDDEDDAGIGLDVGAPGIARPANGPAESGPLSDPNLCYVAICGLTTIYLPPSEVDSKLAFASAEAIAAQAATPDSSSKKTSTSKPESDSSPKASGDIPEAGTPKPAEATKTPPSPTTGTPTQDAPPPVAPAAKTD